MRKQPLTYSFADLWEQVAAAVPDRTALVCGSTRRTFAELDQRASQLASWLSGRGVGRGSFLGVQLRNGHELVETMLASYKLGAVPVNVNYRLTRPELLYVYNDADLVGVVHDASQSDLVAGVVSGMVWTLGTGTEYESAVGSGTPLAEYPTRFSDDPYVLYTGGTTGFPKGVVWTMEDAFFACIGGGDPTGLRGPIRDPSQLCPRILDDVAFLPAAPLIHAAGMWTTLRWLLAGGKVVLLADFSPTAIWAQVAAERVNVMNIVGDAMARPLLDALPEPGTTDLSPLRTIASGGAPLTPRNRALLLTALPGLTVKDSYGSSETGVHGWSVHRAGDDGATRFVTVDTVVLDPDTLVPLRPGSGVTGIVARRGRVPLRYHKDEAKTARTFVTVDGTRYALTEDIASMATDGSLTLFGRGSQCINTGGEKVYPEEVEEVLRRHPDVFDAVVVGSPDDRWGQQVVAVVATTSTHENSEQDLRDACRASLAAFKVPKRILFVPEVQRTAAGKPDYSWATARAACTTDPAVAP
jgi:acyl-CoA synthetase (AMP-forming)/AMP-acid ligase II